MTDGIEEDLDDLGLLGQNGVLIVPPNDPEGGWFVTVSSWNEDMEQYAVSLDGPIFESKEEALEEVQKLLDWILQQDGPGNLVRAWEAMQRSLSKEGTPVDEDRLGNDDQNEPGWPWTTSSR